MFDPIPILLSNSKDFDIISEPVSLGVPIPIGSVYQTSELRLQDQFGGSILSNLKPMAHWPDGSLKWLLLDFQAGLKESNQSQVLLVGRDSSVKEEPYTGKIYKVEIDDSGENILINTGTGLFTISKLELSLFEQVSINGVNQLSQQGRQFQFLDAHGEQAKAVIKSIDTGDKDNFVRRKLTIQGSFLDKSDNIQADYVLTLTFYAGKSTVKLSFCLKNPHAADHPGGVWDLGDKNSLFFKSLAVEIKLAEAELNVSTGIKMSPKSHWKTVESSQFQIYQDSSGGENWQSYNHVNHKGVVPLSFKGFRYFEQDIQISSGDRATPTAFLGSENISVLAHIKDFWQNFPKAIEVNRNKLILKIYPEQFSDHFELQGGEQKTHFFYLDFSNNRLALDGLCSSALKAQIPLKFYSKSKVIPWLTPSNDNTEIQNLINRGIQGQNNFFEKRESIDEYGWRNYGETYADHEEHEYKGRSPLISHYNNQYDALYGFIRQYMMTADSKWFDLLSTLAQHIVDIDIYNTEEDRDEYNGGLFWHTHHYLNAFTCTHRTFSAKHAEDFIYGEIGGGPGAEHCYTTGLCYYYFMTGDEVFKNSALKLVNWISISFESSGTLIERLMLFKNRDLSILKKLFSRESVQKYKYPFTRGTGNYVTALIDAYSLTENSDYISKVEKIFHDSIHPLDDILLRNLGDIENSWSYLILLQAICKYLEIKGNNNEIDDEFIYAKDCLLHYADWMVENETPFLERSEQLEFPNHTWTAQDLRKANILFIASCYTEKKKEIYLNKARYFIEFVSSDLKSEETRYYSRILIILMQNDLQESCLDFEILDKIQHYRSSSNYDMAPLYSVKGIFYDFVIDIVGRILHFSWGKEKKWLSFRINN